MTINPDAPTPLYQQLVRILRERIEDGTYPPGGRMPSRFELEREFGVAPGTISKALDRLKQQGLVIGVGTFAREAESPEP
ncbi:GntR family transcriptional regulator [Actinocorallia libanotica]|uniref:GntR family transcriptional regulator n=1 Tax=Actinocorallia libanotica TaxID=46162 RepID=A0ABN1Q1H4_9ACTN